MTKSVYANGLIALVSAICLTSIASAQSSWWRTYGGTDSDYGYSVQQTADGGYIVTGEAVGDVYLIKTSAQGDTLWTRTYGGRDQDCGYSVQQTPDSGYIIAGYTESFGAGHTDVYLIKTSAQGDTLWTRTYGGRDQDCGYSVQQTPDSGYIIAGYTWSFGAGECDVYLIKTSALGDSLWTRTYGGTDVDVGGSVRQTSDGGFVIAGYTQSFGAGEYDVYLIKTDAAGDTLWTSTYGDTSRDMGYSAQQTSDGGYIVTGYTYSFGAGTPDYANVYLIKTNASGDTVWARTYGGTDSDEGRSVQQTTDGGYIIAGQTWSFGAGTGDVYLIKTNASGDTLWTRTSGGTSMDYGLSVQQTADSGYIITGHTFSFGAGGYDVYLIKTDSNGNVGIEEPLTKQPARHTRFQVQPSPFTNFARVPGHETEVFALSDVTGRQVAVCRGDRIGAGLRPGVYFLSPVGSRAAKSATATIVKTAS